MNEYGKNGATGGINENGKKVVFGGGAFLAAIIVSIIFSFILAAIYYATDDGTTTAYFVWSNILNIILQLSFLGAVLLLSKRMGVKPDYGFKKTSGTSYAAGALTAVVGVSCFYMLSMLFSIGLDAVGFKSDTSSLSGAAEWILTALRVVLIVPVCEEMLLRGGVLTGTNALTAGKKNGHLLSVIMCGFMFMLLHMNPEQTVYQFLLGCLIALLTISSGSLLPAIIAHALNNVIALVFETQVGVIIGEGLYAFFEAAAALFVVVAILAAAGALVGMYFLFKALKKTNESRGYVAVISAEPEDVSAESRQMKRYGIILYAAAAVICAFIWFLQLYAGLS